MHKHNTEKVKAFSYSVVAATVVYREKQSKFLEEGKMHLTLDQMILPERKKKRANMLLDADNLKSL